MSIRIITDSAADIPQNYDEKILVLPLHISFGEEEYLDGVNLSHTEFYEKLIESDELPRTSQLPPFEFEEAYRKVTEAGDTAIVITLAGKLSGTYQSACMAAEKYEERSMWWTARALPSVSGSDNLCPPAHRPGSFPGGNCRRTEQRKAKDPGCGSAGHAGISEKRRPYPENGGRLCEMLSIKPWSLWSGEKLSSSARPTAPKTETIS